MSRTMPRTIRNTVGEFTKTTDTKTIRRLPWMSKRSSASGQSRNTSGRSASSAFEISEK
jgi:hypothetical protein